MEGCRNLLGLLGHDEIVALCDTITNRLVQPEGHQDAIRAVSVYKVQKNFGGIKKSTEKSYLSTWQHRGLLYLQLLKNTILFSMRRITGKSSHN